MDFRIVDLFKLSSLLLIFLYGFIHVASELFSSHLPIAILLIALLPAVLSFIRIKPPSKDAVEAVVGKDLNILNNDDPDKSYIMRTVAHRGAGLDAPENSLIAFKMCAEKGCDAVEFDASITADGVAIIFHDDTLERLTDINKFIKQMKWNDLKNIDISMKHPLREKFKNTKIAKLEDTVIQCLNDKQRMFIDIKDNDAKLISTIINLYQKYPQLHELAVCSSFFPNIIYTIRRQDPTIVCSLAWRPYFFSYENFSLASGKVRTRSGIWLMRLAQSLLDSIYSWALPRLIYYLLGISIILLHKDAISGEVIYKWRCKGVRVIAWTVNQPIEKQHFSRIYKITYLTDTLLGESTAHLSNRK